MLNVPTGKVFIWYYIEYIALQLCNFVNILACTQNVNIPQLIKYFYKDVWLWFCLQGQLLWREAESST